MQEKYDNPISVIRVTWGFPPSKGGSITHILELAQRIDPYLSKQIIITRPITKGDHFDNTFRIQVLRLIFPIFKISSFSILNSIIFSYKAIKEISINPNLKDYRIIHVHGLLIGGLFCFFNRFFKINKPIIVMVHGVYRHALRPLSVSYYMEKPLLRLYHPDSVLLLDDGTDIDNFSQYLTNQQIPYDIVYHGIDTDFFNPEKSDDLSSKSQDKPFILFFPHRPVKVKQPEIALKILENVVKKRSIVNFKLIMISDNDPSIASLLRAYKLHDNVELIDIQDINGMRHFYRLSDVIIGTSLESNMGRAIQEAMACEKPVIVFDCGNMEELISNGVNGILVENGDIECFANSIIDLYENNKKCLSIGKNARSTILNRRNWQTRIAQEIKMYKKLLNSVSGNR